MDSATWTASDYAAWWGALVATFALLWNVLRALRSGPRVRLRVSPGMKVLPRSPLFGDGDFIFVAAVNRGDAPTTITHLHGFYAKSLWARLRRKRETFVIASHTPGIGVLPHVLRPGEEWHGMADQSKMPEHFERGGYFYLGVTHNQSRRPVYARVRFRRPSEPKTA